MSRESAGLSSHLYLSLRISPFVDLQSSMEVIHNVLTNFSNCCLRMVFRILTDSPLDRGRDFCLILTDSPLTEAETSTRRRLLDGADIFCEDLTNFNYNFCVVC